MHEMLARNEENVDYRREDKHDEQRFYAFEQYFCIEARNEHERERPDKHPRKRERA